MRYGSGTDWEWGFFGYVFPAGSDTLMAFERPAIRNNSVAGTFIGEAITETGFDPLLADLNIGSLTGEGISAAVVEGPVGTKQHMVGTCTLDLNLFGSGESDWNCLVAMGDAVNGLTFEAGGTVENGGMLTGAPGVRPDVTTTTPFALTVEGVRFNYQTITFEQFLGTVVGPGPSGPGAPVTGGILDFGILVNGGALLGGHSVVGIAGADTAARYNGSY